MHALHKYIYIVNYFAKGDMESRMMRVLVCVGIFIKFTISIVHILYVYIACCSTHGFIWWWIRIGFLIGLLIAYIR